MSRRFRWTTPLSEAAAVTVTRVAGDHEHGEDPERQYTLDTPGSLDVLAASADVRTEAADGDGRRWVTVPEGAGLAWVRVASDGNRTRVVLPGPAFDEALTEAARGDEDAARTLLAACDSAVELAFTCGPVLGVEGLVDVLETCARASSQAADDLHATRYDLVRSALVTPAGPAVATADEFERLVAGLDAIEAIGDVAVLAALGDVMFVAHESAAQTEALLDELGYDLPTLVEREDGRYFTLHLAQIARTGGVRAARQFASRAARGDDTDYDDAKASAQRADYWDRGAAWRDVVRPAASRSRDAFAYVLANALYWTGEVWRTDSRADELLHAGAAAVSTTIDLDWITAHARFERHRAAAHRHRSSRNHAHALREFEHAIALAEEYAVLDPWEPTYSHGVVRSNAASAAGDHERAVAAVEETLEALRDLPVPEDRFGEMAHHLRGQKQERLALLAGDEPTRLAHLEAALDHYEAVGFQRSVDRIQSKLAEIREPGDGTDVGPAASDRGRQFRGGPRPSIRPGGDTGTNLSDIPSLHDFLTEADTTQVGSPDPGVLPEEDSVPGPGAPPRDERTRDGR